MIDRCIHGKPLSSPSKRMECKDCYELARRERVKLWWRDR